METLLDSFKNWLAGKQNYLSEKGIEQILLTEDVVSDTNRIIVNHSKGSFFGQISVAETNSLSAEIVLKETSEMVFSVYCNLKDKTDFVPILNSYFEHMWLRN